MRARWRFITAAGAILVAACATGGSDDGSDADLGQSPDSGADGPGHHQDGPDSFPDGGGPKDSGTTPPVDSTMPPVDSSLPDVLPFDVLPFDVTLPTDASADAPFMDAGGGAVNCPITFKYILEAEIASESEDPPLCADVCTKTQCCFKPAGICLKK
jgi:hypothetical protein